jgi:hypothetical protein
MHAGEPVMKWISFLVVLVVLIVVLWRFHVLQGIGGAFDDWLKWIGAK